MSARRELGIKHAWATPFYQREWSDHVAVAPSLIAHLQDLRSCDRGAIASGVAPGAKKKLYESEFDHFNDPHPVLWTASSLSLTKPFASASRM